MTEKQPLKTVLFVCMANICRSPAGQGILQHIVDQQNLTDQFFIDSAGIHTYNEGSPADPCMQQCAKLRGFTLASKSRKFRPEDFDTFDLIIPMDFNNLDDLNALDNQSRYKDKIIPLNQFLPQDHLFPNQVPDPYAKGRQGFEEVLNMLQAACPNILNKLNT